MKSFIYFVAAAFILLLAGCSENGTSVKQPTTNQQQLIKLPQKAGLSKKDSQLLITKTIDGKKGGLLVLRGSYLNSDGKPVKVFGTLVIPAHAFKGERTITMSADDEYAGVDFYPHMTFDKPLSLTLGFVGLDLSDLNLANGKVGFFYIDDNGNMTPILNGGIAVNNQLGSLLVVGARIDHFSRYAFAK